MEARTHLRTNARLCGEIVELAAGSAQVVLQTTAEMAVDEQGLVHGGFVFGLADYAAMLAVNEPNVVLGAADCRFLGPVTAGDRLEAFAKVSPAEGKKYPVEVKVICGETIVFTATLTCFVLDQHVLSGT